MSEEKAPSNAGQTWPGSYLVSLASARAEGQRPVLVNAASDIDAARIAYDELGARDSDEILVWTVDSYHAEEEPASFAAGNLAFKLTLSPTGEVAPAQAAGHVDEYFTRQLWPNRFEVYRVVEGEPDRMEFHYCECKSIEAAMIIARALNLAAAMDGRILQTVPYRDGEIVLLIRGDEAERAYLRALPILQGADP
jgi:hypothetical protein